MVWYRRTDRSVAPMDDEAQSNILRGGRRGDEVAEFWRRLQAGRPAFQRCSACASFRFPPGAGCPSCGSTASEWVEPGTEAEVVAWTVTHEAAAARLPSRLRSWTPYVLVLVRFADIDGVLVPALLDGAANGQLGSGAPVRLGAGPPAQPRLSASLVTS